ncbi:alpha/beta hydrolase [Geodermatophilus ruber]|uniref:Acetyl esterase n=1 Tax=Geodermatophilus ruber TaxID=504800 RepID=A0A1I4AER8_9ACTN|nr:alpha/beta hydrolase [Geodermatophilus ruber]SFK54266.1 acetyl esterase [Geodermatophilus ruber]
MALDQATSALLQQMAESGGKPLHEMTPEEARGFGGALRELYGPGPEMARVEDISIPAPHGSIPARVLVPDEAPRAVIVYYHGGGWVIGALDEFDTLGRQLAEKSSSTVVLVDYRLAPEHRYPAAAEDAYTALEWVADHLGELAADGAPLVVMGDSAGGNLSAVVAQRAREGGPAIALQVLVYPVTDCDLDNETYRDPDNQLLLTREAMVWFWDHYAPDQSCRTAPDASPLRVADLSGLPPAVVITAEHDVLRQEGEAYAEAMRAAGVPVDLRRFPGQMHGFFTMPNVLPGAAAALQHVVEQLDSRLSGSTSA